LAGGGAGVAELGAGSLLMMKLTTKSSTEALMKPVSLGLGLELGNTEAVMTPVMLG
jgi:hypothetical protein